MFLWLWTVFLFGTCFAQTTFSDVYALVVTLSQRCPQHDRKAVHDAVKFILPQSPGVWAIQTGPLRFQLVITRLRMTETQDELQTILATAFPCDVTFEQFKKQKVEIVPNDFGASWLPHEDGKELSLRKLLPKKSPPVDEELDYEFRIGPVRAMLPNSFASSSFIAATITRFHQTTRDFSGLLSPRFIHSFRCDWFANEERLQCRNKRSGMNPSQVGLILQTKGVPIEEAFPTSEYTGFENPDNLDDQVLTDASTHVSTLTVSFTRRTWGANLDEFRDILKFGLKKYGPAYIEFAKFGSSGCTPWHPSGGEFTATAAQTVFGYNSTVLFLRNHQGDTWCNSGNTFMPWEDAFEHAADFYFYPGKHDDDTVEKNLWMDSCGGVKKFLVSSQQESYVPSNVVIPTREMYWRSTKVDDSDEWIQFDYGQDVYATSVFVEVQGGHGGVDPRIEGSPDGLSWTNLATVDLSLFNAFERRLRGHVQLEPSANRFFRYIADPENGVGDGLFIYFLQFTCRVLPKSTCDTKDLKITARETISGSSPDNVREISTRNNSWETPIQSGQNEWLLFDFGKPIKPSRVVIQLQEGWEGNQPELQRSTNGVEFSGGLGIIRYEGWPNTGQQREGEVVLHSKFHWRWFRYFSQLTFNSVRINYVRFDCGRYELMTHGKCTSRKSIISRPGECHNAAMSLGFGELEFGETIDLSRPRGCFVDQAMRKVFFNQDGPVATDSAQLANICKTSACLGFKDYAQICYDSPNMCQVMSHSNKPEFNQTCHAYCQAQDAFCLDAHLPGMTSCSLSEPKGCHESVDENLLCTCSMSDNLCQNQKFEDYARVCDSSLDTCLAVTRLANQSCDIYCDRFETTCSSAFEVQNGMCSNVTTNCHIQVDGPVACQCDSKLLPTFAPTLMTEQPTVAANTSDNSTAISMATGEDVPTLLLLKPLHILFMVGVLGCFTCHYQRNKEGRVSDTLLIEFLESDEATEF